MDTGVHIIKIKNFRLLKAINLNFEGHVVAYKEDM